MALASGYF